MRSRWRPGSTGSRCGLRRVLHPLTLPSPPKAGERVLCPLSRIAGGGWGEGDMRIAFYAPLKPPDHPVPSGDRLLARTFVAALRHAGHDVSLASRLRSRDGSGDSLRQQRTRDVGVRLAARLVRRWRREPSRAPHLWFSYHVYHKAPDWIGPTVSAALRIPYVVAEASIARKQRDGRWKLGHAAAAAAIRDADEVICINPADAAGLASARHGDRAVVRLAPFLDVDAFLATAGQASLVDLPERSPPDAQRLIAVGMMRPGNKLASYRLLASALARLVHRPWQLIVVGDGEARTEVLDAFAMLGPDRVHFAGAQPHAAVASLLTKADMFVWPAVDEVIGMGLLEAQA